MHPSPRRALGLALALQAGLIAHAAAQPAAELTGLWRDDQGVEYQFRQVGSEVLWSVDARPRMMNVFRGVLDGRRIEGVWADLPGAATRSAGSLTLEVVAADRLLKVGESVAYPARVWVRVSADLAVAAAAPPLPPLDVPNLALNHPAYQSSLSPRSRFNDAQGAVDGVKDGGAGFETAREAAPWWQVDLLEACALTEIRVFNSLDDNDRARTLEVRLSVDGEAWDTAYRHDGRLFGGADGHPLRVELKGAVARFVRLGLREPGPLHLDEVEVYGRPARLVANAPPRSAPEPRPTVTPVPQPAAAPAAPLAAPSVPRDGFGDVVETRERPFGPAGGELALASGARLELPAGALEAELGVRLVRSMPASVSAPQSARGEVHFLVSNGRPRPGVPRTLWLPAASAEGLAVYALDADGLLQPVAAEHDAARQAFRIEAPEVNLSLPSGAPAPRPARRGSGGPADPPSRTGYVIAPAGLVGDPARCDLGRTGTVLELPGHAFSIVFRTVAACDFAKFVSDSLQEALRKHGPAFADEGGQPALKRLGPRSRLRVELRGAEMGGTNGQYQFLSWNGRIDVNVPVGDRDREGLRETLYHELFHAIQDDHSNMYVGGNVAHWWYEATAEWAGWSGRGQDFVAAVKDELPRYAPLLSVPIQRSGEFGELAYGYSLLVDHAERLSPGGVRQTLLGWSTRSGALYGDLVRQGRLGETYADWVRQVLDIALPAITPWGQARVVESEAETRIFTHEGGTIGDTSEKVERRATATERQQAIKFPAADLPALTTRLYQVAALGVSAPRSVRVRLQTTADFPLATWLVSIPASGNKSFRALPASGEGVVTGLGTELTSLWIAVANPNPDRDASFGLAVTLEKPGRGRLVLRETDFEVYDASTKEYVAGQRGATPTSEWQVDATSFRFHSRLDNFTLEMTLDPAPPELAPLQPAIFGVKAKLEGPRSAAIAITPVMDVSSWQIRKLDGSEGVTRVGPNAWKLSLNGDPAKPLLLSGFMALELNVIGRAGAIDLATGLAKDPTGDISRVTDLFLELQLNGMAKVRYTYVKEKQ